MSAIRSDKILLATLGLLVSFGSKPIREEAEDLFEGLFRNILMRRFLVFAVAYIYSSDLTAASLVTILFIMAMKFTEKVKENHITEGSHHL